MSRLKMLILPALLLIVCSPFFLKSAGAAAASQKGCGKWSLISSPGTNMAYNQLRGVAATSTGDVWAVGSAHNIQGPGNVSQTLIEHWAGSGWSIVPSPNPGSSDNLLGQVTAISPNNAWAVGDYSNSAGPSQTLIEHWNGSSWSVVNSPSPGAASNSLSGITAVSANDIWAVGFYSNGGGTNQPVIEHWDGTQWSIVASPNAGNDSALYGGAAVSSTDIWAVGYGLSGTLTEHWDGTQWSIVASPNPRTYNSLSGVAAVSSTNVWAVGVANGGTLTEHWNGSSWNVMNSPNPGAGYNELVAVAAASANDLWAVGTYQVHNNSNYLGLIEHWNGSQWKTFPNTKPSKFGYDLAGVTALSAKAVWAVGSYDTSPTTSQPLTEFC